MSCANCDKPFVKKPGNRGFFRFSLENSLPNSDEVARTALSSLTGASFTPVSKKRGGQFLCPSCWSSLGDSVKYQSAFKNFWGQTQDATYIGSKRKSDGTSELLAKRPRYTSTPIAKKGPRKSLFVPKARRITKWDSIVTAVRSRQYGRAIRGIYNATKGSKAKFMEFVSQTVRREITKVLALKDFPLCQDTSIQTIADFSWGDTLVKFEEHAPLIFTALKSSITRKEHESTTLKRGKSVPVNLKPQLGTAIAGLLHARAPRKASFLPTVLSIQFWRGGLKRDTIKQLAHTGICLGYKATLAAVDSIRCNFDSAAKTCKNLIEEQLEEEEQRLEVHEDMELSIAMAATAPNIEDEVNLPSDIEMDTDLEESTVLYSDDELVGDDPTKNTDAGHSDTEEEEVDDIEAATDAMDEDDGIDLLTDNTEETAGTSQAPVTDHREKCTVKPPQPGFTMCWDNVGKKVTTRHPTTQTANTYINAALGYIAVNRISTTHMDWKTTQDTIRASDIPIEAFIPDDKDFHSLRSRMEVVVGRMLTRHLPWFKAHFDKCSTPHILHDHSEESSHKSMLINLGVFDENPSSTQGAIGIYQRLQQYVPAIKSEPYTTLVYGDGLSCERGNDAHRARANGLSAWERLEGLEPAAQEFHKEMILLQDFYDDFFKGASAADRGTLCQLKNMFNFRSVKSDISDNFTYAWELMCLVTEGFVDLLATKVLEMPERDSRPQNAPPGIENASPDTKLEYFESVCASIVKKLWHETDTQSLKIATEGGPPLYCCGEERDEGLIGCEERANCPKGEIFHYSCVGIDPDDLPESWYCSDECRTRKSFYRFCHCHEDLGEDVPMIGCAAESACKGFEWYHYQCVGLSEEDLPEGDWFCQSRCEGTTKGSKKKSMARKTTKGPVDPTDYVYSYSRSLTWCGLNLLVRRDAVKEGDGLAMISHWKLDLVHFFKSRHPKYLILANRLIASVNGWLSEKLKNDLVWNRTVNYGGGIGRNLPMDLMNEILNRLFKDLLDAAKGRYTPATLQRCGQIVGPLGESIDAVFDSKIVENELYRHRRRAHDRDQNVGQLVRFLENSDIFSIVCGRSHRAFPSFHYSETPANPGKFAGKMKQLLKVLDKRRAVVINN